MKDPDEFTFWQGVGVVLVFGIFLLAAAVL